MSSVPSGASKRTTRTPGGKLPLAMQIILTPLILRLMDTKKRAY